MIKYLIFAFLFATSLISTALSQSKMPLSEHQKPVNVCRDLLRGSISQIDSGDFDAGLVLLDSVFKCDPSNPDAFYYKALILGWKADTNAAVALLEAGTDKAPLSSRLKILLARHLIDRGNFTLAMENLEKVLAVKPREPEALFLKGRIYEAQNDTAAAAEIYNRAIEISISHTK